MQGVSGSREPVQVLSTSSTILNMRDKEKYIEDFDFPFCDDSSKYEKVAKIGQGTFGEVFKARARNSSKKFVAMKKVLMDNEKEGFPITALREIKILQLLKHENVINLIEICRTKATLQNKYRSTFYLVSDFCAHDLAGLLSNVNVKFSLGEIKKVIQQLLNGLYYIHSNKILHRDMKAANVLITKNGILKLADFGLARAFSVAKSGQANKYTNRVVTLWYRPPELLLGERNYGPPVDMWGAGCIMAEMWTRSPIMQGPTEQQQLILISQLCGSCTPDVWPGVENLDLYTKMELPKGQKRKVKERLKPYVKDPYGCDLLDKLLQLDPAKRYYIHAWATNLSIAATSHVELPTKITIVDRLIPNSLEGRCNNKSQPKLKTYCYLFHIKYVSMETVVAVLHNSNGDTIFSLITKPYDADTALNHDFFWMDPMPSDLGSMLAQHTQSMFEYLAPPRRPGHLRHHHHVSGAQTKPAQSQDSGYQDRVF